MRSKLPEFYAAVAASDYDIVIICETWLVPSIRDAELTPSGWMLFRRDRHNNSDATGFGGGVIVLIRNELRPIEVVTANSHIVEQVWVKLALSDRALIVGGAYIPPRSDIDVYNQLTTTCTSIAERLGQTDDLLLFCDLNLPGVSWCLHDDLPSVFVPVGISSEIEATTVDGLAQISLHQLNNTTNDFGNVLETVFSTRHDDIELTCPAPALAPSFSGSAAHHPVDMIFATKCLSAPCPRPSNPAALIWIM